METIDWLTLWWEVVIDWLRIGYVARIDWLRPGVERGLLMGV